MNDQHLSAISDVDAPHDYCDECVKTGQRWVNLRQCMTCGHVGCCDSSIGKHATAHFHETGHPIMRSAMPGQDWGWCYIDQATLTPAPAPVTARS